MIDPGLIFLARVAGAVLVIIGLIVALFGGLYVADLHRIRRTTFWRDEAARVSRDAMACIALGLLLFFWGF